MKNSYKISLFFLTAVFSLFLFGHEVLAAKFYALPRSGNYGIGASFVVDVKIDSEGDGINAAQASVNFNKDVLMIESVDKTGSVFSFWAEEPTYSNNEGRMTFIGGTINGVSGATLQVLKIKFKSKIAGEGTVSFDDGAITIDDGTGANVLTEMTGANFRISLSGIIPPAPPELPGVTPQLPLPGEPIPAPTLIERAPAPAENIPGAPVVNVPIYPDPNKWYDVITPFLATWALPEDITDVATAINTDPNFNPSKSEKLFDTKIFDILPEGISYLHVRFKNKLGWGLTAHYRLAIDTNPPTPFTIESSDGFKTDNPAPIIIFETSDGLSGLDHYSIKIGDAEAFDSKTGRIKIPTQSPGIHKIIVRAIDAAGNATSDSIDMETLAIKSPTITFATEEVYFGVEGGLIVKGTALQGVDVILSVDKAIGGLVAQGTAHSDADGNWDFVFDEPLAVGKYDISAQAKDQRGALSLSVKYDKQVKVQNPPIIKLGSVEIGAGGSAIILLLILIAGFGVGYWYFTEKQARLSRKIALTGRDASQLQKMISDDLDKLSKRFDEINVAEQKFIIGRISENIKKIEKYILKEIEEINK